MRFIKVNIHLIMQAVRAAGISIISLGITADVDGALLTAISDTYFHIDDFTQLTDILTAITSATCEGRH